jgi:hypothetical protein
MRAGLVLAACAVVAWLSLGGSALAQGDVPNDNSGVDQYAESLPSSGGGKARSVGGRAPVGVPLSARVRASLPSGERGRLLKRVATDPTLGAPAREKGSAGRGRPAAATERPAALSAIGGALFGSSAIWPLLLVMGLSAIAALPASLARRRG